MNNLSWSLASIWNQSLEAGSPEREMRPRTKIWASEMGGSYLDRILKMRGTPPSNPFNARAKRKFEAGNLMEWLVGIVLKRAGILIDKQEWLSHQYPGLCEVSGKLDFLAGGKPDWGAAEKNILAMELPEFFLRGTTAIIDHFRKTYPNGLSTIVLEVKSCASIMFDRYEAKGADPRHAMQIFHYLKTKNMNEGHVVYISKDDLRMVEIGVSNPSYVEDNYRKDIEDITAYVRSGETPPKEAEIKFDEKELSFSANWSISYSAYITSIYGYFDTAEFKDKVDPKVQRWNRILKRVAGGKKMTPDNLLGIEEIKKEFPVIEKVIEDYKAGHPQAPDEPEAEVEPLFPAT